MARHFDLVSHWRFAAPLDRVWAALSAPETWPSWWPCVQSVRLLQGGGADGVGSVRLIRWSTRLPYDICTEIECVESLRHQRIRGRSRGQLHGTGIWLLRAEGAGTAAEFTHVTYVWRVELAQRWMRWTAPFLAALFRWNHNAVMRAGAAGLAQHLAQSGWPRPCRAPSSDQAPGQ